MTEILSCRRLLDIMVFAGFMVHHFLRVNLSIAIINMIATENSTISNITDNKFLWSQTEKNNLLGSFYWGYFITQIPGGRLSEIFGTKIVLGTGILLASVLTILSPAAAFLNYYGILLVRFSLGLSLGIQWPSIFPLATKWISHENISKFMSHLMGSALGIAIILPICGYLIGHFGWPSAFYVTGSFGVIWTLIWFYLIYDAPEEHPRISNEEKFKIIKERHSNLKKGNSKVPWSKVLMSGAVWNVVIGNVCSTFPFYVFLNHLPTYYHDILHFNITQNGWFSSLPFLSRYIGSLICGFAADYLQQRNTFSTLTIRKCCAVITFLVPAILLAIIASWSDGNVVSSMVLINVLLCCSGSMSTSVLANAVDITPSFAGTIFGISQTLMSFLGYFATQLVTLMTKEHQDFQHWAYIFWTLCGIHLLGFIFFMVFASGSVQQWDPQIRLPEEEMLELTLDNKLKANNTIKLTN